MTTPCTLLTVLLLAFLRGPLLADVPLTPAVDLVPSLSPSPVKPLAEGSVKILGATASSQIRVRVTTSFGVSHTIEIQAKDGRFECRYPEAFPGAPELRPGLLYLDATDLPDFGSADDSLHQAGITLIVSGAREALPDLPLVFTDDVIDAQGHKDQQAAQWSQQRTLANLFMHSRAAMLIATAQTGLRS